MGSKSDHQIVFGGTSAGGRGAMVHLDNVQAKFPTNKVLGILDSPLYMDVDSLFESRVSLKTSMA